MNRIERAFRGKKAFIPFITAGDPDLAATERFAFALAEEGADLIEFGIPFSDPVAEGEVIQRADVRALCAGATTDKIFELAARVRAKTQAALAFMTYANPVFVYGADKFAKNCASCGVDALIVPDLPFEEKDELAPFCRKHGVSLISLIAPTSNERISRIAAQAEGFVYCVSSLGVTGVREAITTDIASMISLVKAQKSIPCAVGFGISTPQQAREMAQKADGVIVGSAIVRIIEQYGAGGEGPLREYARAMRLAVDAAVPV